MIVSPSSITRDAIINLLSDAGNGFNACYANALINHPGAPAMAIDYGNPKSRNFFKGDVDPESIEETGTFVYPIQTLFSIAGASTNTQKFQRFAGVIKMGSRFFLSGKGYKNSALMQDFEAWPDCTEDAFLQVLQNPVSQNWPMGGASSILYNGEIAYERKFPMQAGENWLQVLTFRMTFEIVIA